MYYVFPIVCEFIRSLQGEGDLGSAEGGDVAYEGGSEVVSSVRPAVNVPPVPKKGVPSHWTPISISCALLSCEISCDSHLSLQLDETRQ